MRTVSMLIASLLPVACNSGIHSSVDGVYKGYDTRRDNLLTPRVLPMAGAVGPDGHGYFIFDGPTAEPFEFENLMHPGADSVTVNAFGGTRLIPVDVKSAPDGYKFSLGVGELDTSDNYGFTADPATDQPKAMAELAGSYQGNDLVQNTFATATLDAQGNFTGNKGNGCKITGQLSQVDGKNLYTATVHFSGGAGCLGSLSGVAWAGDTDLSGASAKGIYLNVIGSGSVDNGTRTIGVGMSLKLQ